VSGFADLAGAVGAWGPAALRAVVVSASGAVAGAALLRPLLRSPAGPPRPGLDRAVLGAAAAACAGTLLAVPVRGTTPTLAALQGLLVVGAALGPARDRLAVVCGAVLTAVLACQTTAGTGTAGRLVAVAHTAAAVVWLGTAVLVASAGRGRRGGTLRRLAPAAVGAVVTVLVTGLAAVWLDGLRPDAASTGSGFGRVVLGKASLLVLAAAAGAAVWRRRRPRAASRLGLAVLAAATAAGSALAVLPLPPPPPAAGVPLLRTVRLGDETVPVAVFPQRPGSNLVHVGVHAMHTLTVGLSPTGSVPAGARAGTHGGWAVVTLPPGRSRLWVGHPGVRAAVRVDTGGTPGPSLTGPDGPECASAALGALLAGSSAPVTSCPADRLAAGDAAALRRTVAFLAGRGIRALRVTADASPRSRAAAGVVRAAAAAHGLRPGTGGADVVVAGWDGADAALRRLLAGTVPPGGVYLAPWLAAGRLLEYSSGAVVALGFDPYGLPAQQYVAALAGAFPGEAPSAAGYRAWRAVRHGPPDGPTLLYAAAQVSFLPAAAGHDHGGTGWLSGGRLTPATGPLGQPGSRPR
jgi:hypothetical protein